MRSEYRIGILPSLILTIAAVLTIAAAITITLMLSSTAIAGTHSENLPIISPGKTFYPTDDSHVSSYFPDSVAPESGQDYNMYVGYEPDVYEPSNVGDNTRIYLKFDLTPVPTWRVASIDNAILWLRNRYGPSQGYPDYVDENMWVTAKAVDNDNWSESTLTWNNAPSLGSALDNTKVLDDDTIGEYTWYSWDVTSFVKDQIENGNKIVTIALQAENAENTHKDVSNWFYTKDAAEEQGWPRLMLNGLTIPYNVPRIAPDVNYRDAPPGSTVRFQIKVRNTGDNWDNILLSVSDDAGWTPSITPTKLEIENGKEGTATLTVVIPSDENYRVQDNIKITAKSEGNENLSSSENVEVYTSTWIQPPQDDRQVIENEDLKYPGDTIYWLYVGVNAVDDADPSRIYGDERVYLKFDLENGGFPVTENEHVLLYMYCYDANPDEVGYTLELYKCTNDNWYEETMGSRENAWERQPKTSFPPEDLLDTVTINRENAYYFWDVTSFVNSELKGDNVVTFCLKAENENLTPPENFSYGFYSKGAASLAQQPYLAFGPRPVASYVTENWGYPGENVTVDVVINNRGAVVDNYDVTIASQNGWTVSPSATTLYGIAPGENRVVTVTVTIPGTAEGKTWENLIFTVTSQKDNNYSSSNTDVGVYVGFQMDLVADWNLVGFPSTDENTTPNNLFAGMSYTMYYWTGAGYASAPGGDPVGLGVGYWIKPESSTTVRIGVPPDSYSISLVADWNLVSFPVTSEDTTPNNLFENVTSYTMYYWTGAGYASAPGNQPVQPGVGYWIKPSQAVTVRVPY